MVAIPCPPSSSKPAPPRRPVPVFQAAARPRTLELAGAVADGVLLSNASSVEFVRWSLDHVERGARGRPLRRAGLVYTAVADDETLTALADGVDARDGGIAELDVVSDLHGSAEYKREVAAVLVGRAVAAAATRARSLA